MAKNDEQHALYLEKDGAIKLFHGDDVDGARADGWSDPKANKSNGQPWNTDDEAGARDAAAEQEQPREKAVAKDEAKKDAKSSNK